MDNGAVERALFEEVDATCEAVGEDFDGAAMVSSRQTTPIPMTTQVGTGGVVVDTAATAASSVIHGSAKPDTVAVKIVVKSGTISTHAPFPSVLKVHVARISSPVLAPSRILDASSIKVAD